MIERIQHRCKRFRALVSQGAVLLCLLLCVSAISHSQELADTGEMVDAVLLLDSSASMLNSDPGRLRDEGARLFTQFLRQDDHVAVISFAELADVIRPLRAYEGDNGFKIGQQVSSVRSEGLYTDLLAGIEAACRELQTNGRDNASKVVVLLSDGKMDPMPSRGTPETLTARLLFETIPRCRETNVRIHTLALSSEADRDLLRKVAISSEGVNWFTPDAETIHESFAELFLVVKKPQVVPLTRKGFKIDENVREATFYVNNDGSDDITIQSPSGKLYNKESNDIALKWFSSTRFEVVTFRDPEVGNWQILGVPSSEVFATVLTNLKLISDWPPSIVAGEEVVLQVRLQEDEKPVVLPNMSKEIEFHFDVLPTDKVSEPVIEELLVDTGKFGDVKKDDGIFSRTIILEEPGEYRIDLEAKAPTFERSQRIPFRVRPRLISVRLAQLDVLDEQTATTRKEEIVQVELSAEVASLKKVSVKLIAVNEKKQQILPMEITKSANNTLIYESSIRQLPEGDYEIKATVSGENRRRKRVRGKSKVLKYKRVLTELDTQEYIQVKKAEPEKPKSPIIAIILLVLIESGVGGALFMMLKKSQSKISITIPKYEPAPELLESIELLEQKAAETEVDFEDERFSDDYDAPVAPTFSSNLSKLEEGDAAPAPESDGSDAPEEAEEAPADGGEDAGEEPAEEDDELEDEEAAPEDEEDDQ